MSGNGKTILITGAAKRVGRHLALGLAQRGYDIGFTYRTSHQQAASLTQAIEGLGRKALAIPADFLDADAAQHVHRTFFDSFETIHGLINNGSCFYPTPLKTLSRRALIDQFTINAALPAELCSLFASALAKSHCEPASSDSSDRPAPPALCTPGRIINFVDINIFGQPLPHHLAYNASKAALWEITQSLAIELAPRVTVNAIAPGVIDWAESYSEQAKASYLKRVPLGRVGTAEDALSAAAYLLDQGHYLTGQAIKLDGGRSIT